MPLSTSRAPGDTITAADINAICSAVNALSNYTDEQVRDVIAAALVAGANMTITPDDAADTITLAPTGGGGGAGWTQVVNETGSSLANWTSISGTWAVDAGGYIKQTDTTAAYRALRYTNRVPMGPAMVMQADIAWSGAAALIRAVMGPATTGLITSPFSHALGGLDKTNGGYAQRGDQATTALGPTTADGVWATVRTSLVGQYLTVAVNGTQMGTIVVNSVADQRIDYPMLVCYSGEVRYKNIKVWRLDGPA